jgi:putative oxidoreductase
MRRIFNAGTAGSSLSFWLLLLRVTVACLMLVHGWPKFLSLVNGNMQFADPIGVGPKVSLFLTVFAEVFCSIAIFIGLVTRLAAIPLIINMMVVAFIVHGKDLISKKELALLYLLIYITIALFGAGRFSLDNVLGGGSKRRR